MAGIQLLRLMTSTKAGSGDHFIMGLSDRRVTVTPYEGTDTLTFMPYPGFKPRTFTVAAGSPNYNTAWSASIAE